MWFDTPIYVVFLIVVVAAYWQMSRRQQNIFLLVASYFFYGWWDYRFLLLMLGSTTLDFFFGRAIYRSNNPQIRRTLLLLSLGVNFGILGLFKYFGFFVGSFEHFLSLWGVSASLPILRIMLPPGISFYTFQEVAYIVDVYKRKIPASESFVDYALFISLFPHLIAGPIQRPGHLLPQVQTDRIFRSDRFYDGILLILSGLFRKCVVADNCALLANAAFSGGLGSANLWVLLIGTYAFAWQIYGDFSGYSDIARGSAQLLGFDFMVNFRQPYLATSVKEFWRRWHISLSTWLRDYLYIPLGGSAEPGYKTYLNLFLTMLLGGLWHGANWTFVVWGALHGSVLAAERWVRENKVLGGLIRTFTNFTWIRRIVVFQFVCLAWIFFRADSVSSALQFLRGALNLIWHAEYLTAFEFLALFSVPLLLLDLYLEHTGEEYVFQERTPALRTALAVCILTVITLFSANSHNAFIYFQF